MLICYAYCYAHDDTIIREDWECLDQRVINNSADASVLLCLCKQRTLRAFVMICERWIFSAVNDDLCRDTVQLLEADIPKLQAFHMTYQRRILGIH